MTPNPTAYLIYGPTAAGKSTCARKLATEKKAVRFVIDEWMHALFGDDRPEKMDLAWVMSRVARCWSRIWATCTQILAAGTVFEPLGREELPRSRAITEEIQHG